MLTNEPGPQYARSMQLIESLRTSTAPETQHPLKPRFFAPGTLLATLCLLTVPAWPQSCNVPSGVYIPPAHSSCTDFFTCFVSGGNLPSYGIPLTPSSGATTLEGDLNSTYFSMYYSIANLQNYWMAAPNNNCPIELVIVGSFPDARYFSITDYDMHYTNTQHLLDADIDPVGTQQGSYVNPFSPGQNYTTTNEQYMVPITLGYVPTSQKTRCTIDPFEGDNLLDATQRHLSMDWNTVAQSSTLVSTPPTAHAVDTYQHSTPNTAGDIVIRNYLAPAENCSSPTSCGQPTPVPTPYLIVRDVSTGCAYTKEYLTVTNPTMVYNGTNGSTALVSTTGDPSPSPTPPNPSWLDTTQFNYHVGFTYVTPQACYANGGPSGGNSLPNNAAWVRGPEWVNRPGPEDTYIGAQISPTDLLSMGSTSGKAIRMRFKLPLTPTPTTPPCQATGTPPTYNCTLSGTEPLRYWSISFIQQQQAAGGGGSIVLDPDGIDAPATSTPTKTIISLADTAFVADPDGYVTLIVGVGATIPAWLTTGTGATGTVKGVVPIANLNGGYSVIRNTTAGQYGSWYTVLDLSQFVASTCPSSAACFNTTYPLELVIRNTLPNTAAPAPFNCSAAAVPFYTAQYTNSDGAGGGLMGPYVPLIDYQSFSALNKPANTSASDLPSPSSCGVLAGPPTLVTGLTLSSTSPNEVQWPTYWPGGPSQSGIQNLSCPPGSGSNGNGPPPTIYFATTQRNALAPSDCGQVYTPASDNPCAQIYAQTTQSVEGQPPPVPVALVGTGFGFLPQHQDTIGPNEFLEMGLPFVPPPGANLASSNFLRIHDDGYGGINHPAWDTNTTPAQCQGYIANWTDSSIWVELNLPVNATDYYSTSTLSPLSDVSPLTFFLSTSPANTMNCPVTSGDTLTFYVTNPQGGGTTSPGYSIQAQ